MTACPPSKQTLRISYKCIEYFLKDAYILLETAVTSRVSKNTVTAKQWNS